MCILIKYTYVCNQNNGGINMTVAKRGMRKGMTQMQDMQDKLWLYHSRLLAASDMEKRFCDSSSYRAFLEDAYRYQRQGSKKKKK